MRKRVIKKIVFVDGKPVETEEIVEEPEDAASEIAGELSKGTVTTETICEPEVTTTVHKVIRKRIIKKIVVVDGKPIETEEVIEEPEVINEILGEPPMQTSTTEVVGEPQVTMKTTHKILRKRIIKKIVIVDGN